jgi:hypothetical protein
MARKDATKVRLHRVESGSVCERAAALTSSCVQFEYSVEEPLNREPELHELVSRYVLDCYTAVFLDERRRAKMAAVF